MATTKLANFADPRAEENRLSYESWVKRNTAEIAADKARRESETEAGKSPKRQPR
jgi:hypothetical protein